MFSLLSNKKLFFKNTLQNNLIKKFLPTSRNFSEISSNEKWKNDFEDSIKKIIELDINQTSYLDSSNHLRVFLKTGILLHNDLIKQPQRFFLAHKLLAKYSPKIGPGFWIRFTVHYNLCVGTILGLGNDEQIEALKDMQEKGIKDLFSLLLPSFSLFD